MLLPSFVNQFPLEVSDWLVTFCDAEEGVLPGYYLPYHVFNGNYSDDGNSELCLIDNYYSKVTKIKNNRNIVKEII